MTRCLLWMTSHIDDQYPDYSWRKWTFVEALKSVQNLIRKPDQFDISSSGEFIPIEIELKNLNHRYRGKDKKTQFEHFKLLVDEYKDESPDTVVLFLDNDDLIHPLRIKEQVEIFEKHPNYEWTSVAFAKAFTKFEIRASCLWWKPDILYHHTRGRKKKDILLTKLKCRVPPPFFSKPPVIYHREAIPEIRGGIVGQEFATLGCRLSLLREFFSHEVKCINIRSCDCEFMYWLDKRDKERGFFHNKVLYYYRQRPESYREKYEFSEQCPCST